MTAEERTLCEELEKSFALATEEDILQYAEASRLLPQSNDPDVLSRMLRCLNSVDAGEVQYELVEAVERFPDSEYVSVVMRQARELLVNAGHWGWMIIQSMLNSEETLQHAVRELKQLDQTQRREFMSVLGELAGREPHYLRVVRLFDLNPSN